MAEKQSETEDTPLNLTFLVWFIDKTVPPKHKILLYHLRTDVCYSGGVKCCWHMFLPDTGGTTQFKLMGRVAC